MEIQFSVEAQADLRGLLQGYASNTRITVGDEGDMDWEAHYTRQICDVLGKDLTTVIAAVIEKGEGGILIYKGAQSEVYVGMAERDAVSKWLLRQIP